MKCSGRFNSAEAKLVCIVCYEWLYNVSSVDFAVCGISEKLFDETVGNAVVLLAMNADASHIP